MRREKFWIVLSFRTRDEEALENEMRDSYMKRDRIGDI